MISSLRLSYLVALLLTSMQYGLAQKPPSQANLIHVEFGALRNDKGKVLCALFASPDGFPKGESEGYCARDVCDL
jgi:uncharacterized protein (DUF2141 family)